MIRVLVVDDHDLVRTGISRMLADIDGLQVVGQAESGEAAIKKSRELKPDVVLMDVKMPGIGGLEATRKLLRSHPDIKVIAVTICEEDPFPTRLLQAGAAGYLLKESAGEEVIDAVRAVHAGRRYLSEESADRFIDGYLDLHGNPEASDPLAALSPRELEVLQLVVEGKTSPEIARILTLSPKTIETYRGRLMRKLAEGGAFALLIGLLWGLDTLTKRRVIVAIPESQPRMFSAVACSRSPGSRPPLRPNCRKPSFSSVCTRR